MSENHINFDIIENNLNKFACDFKQAIPFEHVIIDDFLCSHSLETINSIIKKPDVKNRSNDYMFARNKFENPKFHLLSPIFSELRDEILSVRFQDLVSTIYGKKVFIDSSFLGGGLHQGGAGSYLDMHSDFSRHGSEKEWLRELNLLLYLNEDYQELWGGDLDLVNSHTGETSSIAPKNNRLVIMLTKAHTVHGYKAIEFPNGVYRNSIASYAYSVDTDFTNNPITSTGWQPSTSVLRALIGPLVIRLVKIKVAIFGSNTTRKSK